MSATLLDVFVPGIPKPQPRPRAFARNGKARVFDAGTAEGWKSAVAMELRPVAGRRLAGPLSLRLVFRLPRPKAHYRSDGTVRPSAPIHWHAQRPDLDNLEKAVLDAMTAIGVWQDDAQVVTLSSRKSWADPADAGCCIYLRDEEGA